MILIWLLSLPILYFVEKIPNAVYYLNILLLAQRGATRKPSS